MKREGLKVYYGINPGKRKIALCISLQRELALVILMPCGLTGHVQVDCGKRRDTQHTSALFSNTVPFN